MRATSVCFSSNRLRRSLSALILLIVVASTLPLSAGEEIPHENYEYVSPDIQIIIELLNTSINYTELSLIALYHEEIREADENLTIVRGLLGPAEQLILAGSEESESFKNLTILLPPFTALSAEEGRFVNMEASLIAGRDVIRSFASYVNLTQEQALQAIAAISSMRSLIVQMNHSIDVMIGHAVDITDLEVEERQPFRDNDLVELLERLRELLYLIEIELGEFLETPTGSNPWESVLPFISLYVVDQNLYLGERLEGGGYLFYNSTFRPSNSVNISLDGESFLTVTTQSQGMFTFTYDIPRDESWLGSHQLVANASYTFGTLVSETVSITVSLIPTRLTIAVSKTLLAPSEIINVNVTLKDVYGIPLQTTPVNLTVSDSMTSLTTDELGRAEWSTTAGNIGFGTQSIYGRYDGGVPYAASQSPTVLVTVNIETSLDLTLVSETLVHGDYIAISGYGILVANGSEPIRDQTITISIDGRFAQDVTTNAEGEFAFSIDNTDLTVGHHAVTAELRYKDVAWRYSSDTESFSIVAMKPFKYPFWPYIPGWQDLGPSRGYPDMFFGPSGYIMWLFLILVLAAIVKSLQVRRAIALRRMAKERLASMSESFEVPTAASPPAAAPTFGSAASMGSEAPEEPNALVIWYYNRLMRFLVGKVRIGIIPTMTHREIATMLWKVGYPFKAVDRITMLFEKAMYSGTKTTEPETESMRDLVENVERMKPQEGSVAT